MVAVTVGVAWLGIRSVLGTAAPARRTLLSTADLRRAAPVTPSKHASPVAQLEPGPVTPAPTPVPSAAPSASVVPPASPSAASASAASAFPATSATSTPAGVWAPVPDGRGGTAYRRTFRTDGGTVTFSAAPGDVRVLSSGPRAGFTEQTTRLGGDAVVVSFTRGQTGWRVLVRWWNGPYAEVTEALR